MRWAAVVCKSPRGAGQEPFPCLPDGAQGVHPLATAYPFTPPTASRRPIGPRSAEAGRPYATSFQLQPIELPQFMHL